MELRTPIEVRYGETDMMGVVYHANYLLYLEDARCDFLVHMGSSYAAMEAAGCMCPVRSIELNYNAPLHYGDQAYVLTEIEQMRATRAVYHQRIFLDSMDPLVDTPLVDAHIMVCFVRKEDFKPTSFKKYFPELFEKYRAAVKEREEAE